MLKKLITIGAFALLATGCKGALGPARRPS
jgi:hypothetical protein